jgi:nitrate reductase NapAB chaperone NapD
LCAGATGNGTSDYDPTAGVSNLTSVGSSDIFVLKISQCGASFSSITASACDSYTSPSGKVWTSSNTYMDTITNASNCDSIISINLTINTATTSSITASACDSYISPSGKVWTSSNTYMDTIANASNCDSIISINLTINTIDTSVTQNGITLISNETGATYQWIECVNMTAINGAVNASFTPVSNGNYAVVVTKNGCTDTSACYFVTVVGIVQHNFDTELLLYPNPTKGDFVIDLGAVYESVNLTLTDLSGKVIETKTYQERQWLNLTLTQAAGVYLLTIESADKRTVVKLIKN